MHRSGNGKSSSPFIIAQGPNRTDVITVRRSDCNSDLPGGRAIGGLLFGDLTNDDANVGRRIVALQQLLRVTFDVDHCFGRRGPNRTAHEPIQRGETGTDESLRTHLDRLDRPATGRE